MLLKYQASSVSQTAAQRNIPIEPLASSWVSASFRGILSPTAVLVRYSLKETETGNVRCQPEHGTAAPLLQRRIGLCGDATRAPTGACKQQKGRAVFATKAVPAPSPLLEQQQSEKSIPVLPPLLALDHPSDSPSGAGSRTSCAGRRCNRSSGTNSILMPQPACVVSIRPNSSRLNCSLSIPTTN